MNWRMVGATELAASRNLHTPHSRNSTRVEPVADTPPSSHEVTYSDFLLSANSGRNWTMKKAPIDRQAPAATTGQVFQAAGISVGLTVLWRLASPAAMQPCCDAAEYLLLAREPSAAVPRPFNTRVLVPWLVHALGTEPSTTYHVIALACLAGAGVLTYLLARRLGVGHAMALVAVAGLECSRAWVFYFYDPYLSDPAALLLCAGVFLVLVSGWRAWLIAPLLVLLAGAREVFAGFAAPLYAWWRREGLDATTLGRIVAILAPAALAFVLIAKLTPSRPPNQPLWPFGPALEATIRMRVREDGSLWFATPFAMSLGMWWPLAAASLGRRPFRRLAWWLVPVFAIFLLGWDWSRYALYAYPVVIPAAAATIERASRRGLLLWLAAAQALVPLLDLAGGKPSLNHPGPSLGVSLTLILVTAVVLLAGPKYRPALSLGKQIEGENP